MTSQSTMKTAACFVMVLLVITTLANTASMTAVHEAVSSSIRTRLGKGLRGVLPRGGEVLTSEGRKVVVGEGNANTMRLVGGPDEESNKHTKKMMKTCMTQEQCNKKKVVCFKKCTTDSISGEVGVVNSSAAKCIVKCKKCVPDC